MLLPTQEIKNTLAKVDILVGRLTEIAEAVRDIVVAFRNLVVKK